MAQDKLYELVKVLMLEAEPPTPFKVPILTRDEATAIARALLARFPCMREKHQIWYNHGKRIRICPCGQLGPNEGKV